MQLILLLIRFALSGRLQVLKKLAEQHWTRPFSYLWAEGGAQPALEASVGVGGSAELPLFHTKRVATRLHRLA